METQYFEGNKDCDLFGIVLRVFISLFLELILAWFWDP